MLGQNEKAPGGTTHQEPQPLAPARRYLLGRALLGLSRAPREVAARSRASAFDPWCPPIRPRCLAFLIKPATVSEGEAPTPSQYFTRFFVQVEPVLFDEGIIRAELLDVRAGAGLAVSAATTL